MKINGHVANLQYSLIRQVDEHARKYDDVINFTIGDPDIATPRDIISDVCEFANKGQFGYAPTAGGVETRQMVAEFYNKNFGTHFTKENCLFNIGASEALASAIRAITNPGDEVIIFAPYFTMYRHYIELAYAKAIIVDITKNDFKITPELLAKYITPRTKAILFCNPCNPTGIVMSKDEISAIVDYLADKDIFVIADEIYALINFYGFTSFGTFDKILDKLIIVSGFSKSHSMTGWRIGYTIVPAELQRYFINTTLYNVSSPATLSLVAAESAMKKHAAMPEMVAEYQKRAETMYAGLIKLGFSPIKPQGAFYIYTSYEKLSDKGSLDFAMEMIDKAKVATVPGVAFDTEGYLRIALTLGVDKINQAIERIAAAY